MLHRILGAKYSVQQHRFHAVLEQEVRLRRELDLLRTRALSAQKTTCEKMMLVGADVVWHGWVDRKITELNRHLAQTLAQKEHELALLKKEFGKKYAGEQLLCIATERARRQKNDPFDQ